MEVPFYAVSSSWMVLCILCIFEQIFYWQKDFQVLIFLYMLRQSFGISYFRKRISITIERGVWFLWVAFVPKEVPRGRLVLFTFDPIKVPRIRFIVIDWGVRGKWGETVWGGGGSTCKKYDSSSVGLASTKKVSYICLFNSTKAIIF